jgi:3-oxoacyl-[acyl-carrier-protein] synthase-3
MLGREVFRHAVEKMSAASLDLITSSNMVLDDISYVIPHQANLRIIEAVTKNLNIDQSKVIKTVDKHANCSAASIPMALHSLKQSGTIKDGDVILTVAIGAGLTWGSNLIRWHQNDNIN